MRICEMPEMERPQARLFWNGPEALSTAELISLITGNGDIETCQRLTADAGSLSALCEMTPQELVKGMSMTERQAASIIAAAEVGRRIEGERTEARTKMVGPDDAAEIMMPILRHQAQEQVYLLSLDVKGRLIAYDMVALGGASSASVEPGPLLKTALARNAVSVILCHNHPSGDPTPSEEDVRLTKRMGEAFKLIGLNLADHIVIGDGIHASLRRKGLI